MRLFTKKFLFTAMLLGVVTCTFNFANHSVKAMAPADSLSDTKSDEESSDSLYGTDDEVSVVTPRPLPIDLVIPNITRNSDGTFIERIGATKKGKWIVKVDFMEKNYE